MPKLAAFPKGFTKQLVAGQMSIYESADFLREKIKKYWPNYQPR